MKRINLFTATTAEEVEQCIARGDNIGKYIFMPDYTSPHGVTPLFAACIDNKFEVVKALVNNGANIHFQGHFGCCSYKYAAEAGNLKIVEFLIENTEENLREHVIETCLLAACGKGHCDIFDKLILLEPNINKKYLRAACMMDQVDIVDRLLQLGVNVNDGIRGKEDSSLIIACSGPIGLADNYLPIINRLICFGADFNFQGRYDETALMKCLDIKIMERLISVGADLNLRDYKDKTALFRQCVVANTLVVELLLNAGAEIHFTIEEIKSDPYYKSGLIVGNKDKLEELLRSYMN